MAPRLTDRQQSAVLNAANPLEGCQRDAFMIALALLLNNRSEIGDGELFRILRELQREHYDFPRMTAEPKAHTR